MKILIKNIQSLDTSCLLTNRKPYYMDDVRWKKMHALKMENDRLRSLAAGYLLYKMCEELKIEKPRYEYEKKGKPFIAGYENIVFNLSHSGDYVVLVYDENCDTIEDFWQQEPRASLHAVGVDVQQIRPLHEGMKIRILNEKEKIPEGLSKEEEIAYLNRVWCIKESYVKMTGEGLALDFRKIVIDLEKEMIHSEGFKTAYFSEYHGVSGYVLSVCSTKIFDTTIMECV